MYMAAGKGTFKHEDLCKTSQAPPSLQPSLSICTALPARLAAPP